MDNLMAIVLATGKCLNKTNIKTTKLFAILARFKKEINKVFRDINKRRTVERSLQALRQTRSAASYTA
jgi:hypothetical protein